MDSRYPALTYISNHSAYPFQESLQGVGKNRVALSVLLLTSAAVLVSLVLVAAPPPVSTPTLTIQPNPGNQATYIVTNESVSHRVTATWGLPTSLPLGNGGVIQATPLWLHWFQADELTKIVIGYYTASGIHAVETRQLLSESGGGQNITAVLQVPHAENSSWRRSAIVGDASLPCGFSGRQVRQWIELAGPCFGSHQDLQELRESKEQFNFVSRDGTTVVSYDPSSSFPQHMMRHGEQWVRVALASGAIAEEIPAAANGAGVRLAAATPWGPDDRDVTVDFPLSQAYYWATRPRQPSPSMHEFLQRPGAYLAEASLHSFADESGSLQQVWQLVASDGRAWLERHVYKAPSAASILAEEFAFQVRSPSDAAGRIPPPIGHYPQHAALPQEMPTVVSAFHRMEKIDPAVVRAGAPNVWSFRHQCPTEACNLASTHLSVGWTAHSVGRPDIPEMQPRGERLDSFQVYFNESGAILGWQENRNGQALYPLGGTPTSLGGVPSSKNRDVDPWQPAALAFGVTILYMAWRAVRPAILALFSRTDDSRLLDQSMRRQIMNLVASRPGITFSALVEALHTGRGIVDHHLAKMKRAGLILEVQANRVRAFHQPGAVEPEAIQALPLIARSGARSVLRAILEKPGLTLGEVARAAGLAPSTTSYHVQHLLNAGLIVQRQKGRARILRASSLGGRLSPFLD
jgi:DNA-binding transcriptional ArsR family regulator